MIQQIITFFNENITGSNSRLIINILEIGVIVVASVTAYYLMRLLEVVAMYFINKSSTKWDDDLLNQRFLKAVSQLMPAAVVAWLLPQFFKVHDMAYNWVSVITRCYILWAAVYIIHVFISNLYTAFSHRRRFRAYAVKGIFQMTRLIVVGVGVIVTVSIVFGRSPMSILMGLGASAAILMLVFKDTILGLVASVQLTANNMLRKGDWIIVDKHGANGEVIDISLTTIKVLNWDNSVTTVPPYTLVSESFKNYQPMRKSGGRRVDRSILIDANSVGFCTPSEIEELSAQGWLEDVEVDNAARMINLRLLRAYLENYLATHPEVRHDMLTMVRQMEPTPTGLPLQLYFFTTKTEWKEFERVQSDIFDHVYAVIRRFGLRVYQVVTDNQPSSH